MRKFIVLFIAVFSAFVFNSCEDSEIIEYKYKLKGNNLFSCKNIVIHEIDKSGSIVKKHSIYELDIEEYSQAFTTSENATEMYIYFEANHSFLGKRYIKQFEDINKYNWETTQTNIIELFTSGEITQEEYNFYTNQ